MTEYNKSFACPKELWNKMSEEDKILYNKYMDRLDTTYSWYYFEGEKPIGDPFVVSHNAIILMLDSFNK